MAIYIVQHGKCLPKSEDPEKGLNSEGKLESARIADVAGGYAVKVTAIFHSGKKRAQETAEIFAARLDPEKGIQSRGGMNPMDDVSAFADQLPLNQNIMLVGHLPFLERLISLLVCGDADLATACLGRGRRRHGELQRRIAERRYVQAWLGRAQCPAVGACEAHVQNEIDG